MALWVGCCIEGCKHAGTLEFRIAIPPTGALHLGLAVCNGHRPEVNVGKFLTPEVRDLVSKSWPAADMGRAFLEWMKLP